MLEFLLKDPSKLWVIFSLAVFLVIAYRMGKQSVIDLLDGRIAEIKDSIESAETLRVEAQELLAQYQRKHKDAVKEAENIILKAEKQAEDIKISAEKELNANIERREKQLTERLERMENAAIEEIRQYAADLAMNATAQIIEEKLTKAANTKLVDASIKDMDKHVA